jgi:hypothetical protein
MHNFCVVLIATLLLETLLAPGEMKRKNVRIMLSRVKIVTTSNEAYYKTRDNSHPIDYPRVPQIGEGLVTAHQGRRYFSS